MKALVRSPRSSSSDIVIPLLVGDIVIASVCLSTNIEQIQPCGVTCLHKWGMQEHLYLAPSSCALGRGQKLLKHRDSRWPAINVKIKPFGIIFATLVEGNIMNTCMNIL